MGQNGKCWAKRTWRIEDVRAYTYRLHLEYARLMNSDDPSFVSTDFPLNVGRAEKERGVTDTLELLSQDFHLEK